MDTLQKQLKSLKTQIYLKLIILDIITRQLDDSPGTKMLNIMNNLSVARSWIGKALSYIRGTDRQYSALREHVADRAEPDDHPEGDAHELLVKYQGDIQQLIDDLSTAYRNPGVADLSDNALMCLEYAWQHLNEADFHLAYLLDYRITMQQTQQNNTAEA